MRLMLTRHNVTIGIECVLDLTTHALEKAHQNLGPLINNKLTEDDLMCWGMAEGRGFEPRRGFHPNTLSRRAP